MKSILIATLIAWYPVSTTLAKGRDFRPKTEDPSYKTKIHIQPRIGASWQSTLFKPVFNFGYIDELFFVRYPVNFERGTQGFGIDFGANILVDVDNRTRMGVRPNVRYRYDYYYGIPGFPLYGKMIKASIIDLGLYYTFSHVMQNNGEWLINIGYTFNQIGKKRTFDLSKTILQIKEVDVKFQYPSLNFGFEYDFYKLSKTLFLSGSFMANYIPHGHPAYPWRDFMTLGFGVSLKYKPQFLEFSI